MSGGKNKHKLMFYETSLFSKSAPRKIYLQTVVSSCIVYYCKSISVGVNIGKIIILLALANIFNIRLTGNGRYSWSLERVKVQVYTYTDIRLYTYIQIHVNLTLLNHYACECTSSRYEVVLKSIFVMQTSLRSLAGPGRAQVFQLSYESKLGL